jgi:hypothetical protein
VKLLSQAMSTPVDYFAEVLDPFVRDVVRELAPELRAAAVAPHEARELAIPVNNDLGLSAFMHSMVEYFANGEQLAEALLSWRRISATIFRSKRARGQTRAETRA